MTNTDGLNAMLPYLGRLVETRDIASEIKLMRIELLNESRESFGEYQPGQFAFLSALGIGEAPFGMASIPAHGEVLEFAVQRLGSVTTALHEMGEGDLVGVRGPFGRPFPMEVMKGKNLIVLGGGIGGAPLRPVIQTVLESREEYGYLTILWAARKPSLMIFRDELEIWREEPDCELHLTVDESETGWERNGFHPRTKICHA